MWQKIVKWSVCGLVFLLPLFFLTVSFEAFEFNKTYILVLFSGVGLIAWLARMVFEDKKVKFKKGPLDWFVLAYLLFLILNAVFSVDKNSTVFGFYGRFWPSFIGAVSLIVFYFLLTNNVAIKTKDQKQKTKNEGENLKNNGDFGDEQAIDLHSIVKTFLWSSFFVLLVGYFSLFGVWQNVGKSLSLPAVMMSKVFNPVGGSFQQMAVFLSFVFVLLVSVIAFDQGKKNPWRYLFLFLTFVFLIIVDFWPAWLAVFVPLLALLVFSFWKRIFKEDVNRLSLSVLFLIISVIFLFSSPLADFLSQTNLLSIPEEVRLSQGISWKIGLNALKENIVFGAGQSNFNYLFSKHKPASFLESPFWQLRFDRSSSNLAEMLGTTGVLGVLSWAFMVGMFLTVSWLVLSAKTSNLKIQLPLILTFLSVLAAQFVFYENAAIAFCFWLFLGLSTISWGKPQKEKTIGFKDYPEIGLLIGILFWVILLGIGFFFFILAKNYGADVYYKKFLVNPIENIGKMEKAVRLFPQRADYHMALARGYLLLISQEFAKEKPDNQRIINLVALSINEGRRATEIAPRRIAAQETLGVVFREIQGLAQGALEWSIKTFEAALSAEPKNPILMTELGQLMLVSEKKEEAKTLFQQALALRADYAEPAIALALISEDEGEPAAAISMIEDLLSRNPYSIDARFHLGRLYFNEKKYDEARNQFESALLIFPSHSNSIYSLGLLHERQGNYSKALEYYERALDLNPGNEILLGKIAAMTGEKPEAEVEEKSETGAEK